MAKVKSTNVTAKVTRVYTLDNGSDVTVYRDEETGLVRCIYIRNNPAIEGVSQDATKFNVQCPVNATKVNVKSLSFGQSGDVDVLDEIEASVLELASWSISEASEVKDPDELEVIDAEEESSTDENE